MITRELLGRAHGALSVSDNGPCVAVLREILESIEGDVPSPHHPAVVAVSTLGSPTLMYVSTAGSVDLGRTDVQGLRDWAAGKPVELRFIEALLDHAANMVAGVLLRAPGQVK